MTRPNLHTALHREIARRADASMRMIDKAADDRRHQLVGQAASDLLLWLMLANQLGWSSAFGRLEEITITGPLARRLRGEDLHPCPKGLEDWDRMARSVASTIARVGARADQTAATSTRLRELFAIRDALASHRPRRKPDMSEPVSQEAA